MKILTVSVAAYNVEQYLESALRSLCDSETAEDIEVLVIDDGSTDQTGKIAKKFEQRYPDTVKYIAKDNGGHGSTINKGIELATGKYFRILDGDDAVDPEAFANYLEQLKNCKADVVVTDYWWTDDEGKRYAHNHAVFGNISKGRMMAYDGSLDSSLFGISTLSIKTELLRRNGVRITEHCYYVDVEFIIWALAVSKNFIFYSDKVYLYRCVGTVNNSVNKKNMLKNVDMQKTVAIRLCTLFHQFEDEGMLDDNRRVLILDRISLSITSLYRTWLLCDNVQESKANILAFESGLQDLYAVIYEFIGQKQFVHWIRKENYAFIGIIRIAYRGYLKLKKKI